MNNFSFKSYKIDESKLPELQPLVRPEKIICKVMEQHTFVIDEYGNFEYCDYCGEVKLWL